MAVDLVAHLVASSVDGWVGWWAAMLADYWAAQLVASTAVMSVGRWADTLAVPMDNRLDP